MGLIKYEHIKIVQHNMGNGVTEPKLAMTDDNAFVVIKTFNGPQGSLVLFNELFCYRLAVLLNMTIPKSGICLIDNMTIIYNDCDVSHFGYGFYSSYLPKAGPIVESIISLVKNRDEFIRILLFDHIIFNTDRNLGNLLVQYYNNCIIIYTIDHSHVFINQTIWDSKCLKIGIEEKDYYSTRILEENSHLYDMFFRCLPITKDRLLKECYYFKDRINKSSLYSLLDGIPEEWLNSRDDIEALIDYILYRVDHLDDICSTILSYLNR